MSLSANVNRLTGLEKLRSAIINTPNQIVQITYEDVGCVRISLTNKLAISLLRELGENINDLKIKIKKEAEEL